MSASIQLRPYQSDILDRASHAYKRVRSVLIQAPTGSGKSQMGAAAAARALSKGRRVFWITHRRELIRQVSRTLTQWDIDHGIVSAGFPPEYTREMQICSLDTLRRRFESVPAPGLIIWDEARHLAANTWKAVYDRYPFAAHLGLDATPQRNDGKGLAEFFQEMVRGPEPRWLIDNGFLSDFKLYAPESPDLSGLHTRYGDYVKSELEATFDKPAVIGNAVAHYQRFAPQSRALVFCVSIKVSEETAEAFRQAGIPALHADGATATELRDGILDDFTRGTIRVLCSVNLFTEGLDIAGVDCVMQLRPTQSRALYLQMIGRGLRPFPGKQRCLILDACANWERHGSPTDPYDWALTYDDVTGKKPRAQSLCICASCFCALPAQARVCSECGYEFPAKPREIEQRDGELAEVTPEMLARRAERREQGQAQSLEALMEIARRKGYSPTWADHVLAGRLAKQRRQA